MKIGILTFHNAHNYGSMLLAYALQEALKKQKHEVKIINHRILAQNIMYSNPIKFTHKLSIKSLFINPKLFIANTRKWYKFAEFTHSHHNLTKKCSSLVEVEQVILEEHFDAVITGGDQIWNMQCSDFSLAYYLPFDIKGVKKISYSPSFGGGGLWKAENYSHSIKGLLDGYDSISVREKTASDFLTSLMGREIPSVCDPTILLDKDDYEKLAGDHPLVKGKYVLYYSPFSTLDSESMAIRIGNKMNSQVITSNGEYFQCKGMKRLQNVGPKEFLNLIKYADIVCGNSFHMAVFSILLDKQFIVLSKADARMESLMNQLGISDYFHSLKDEIPSKLPLIKWEKVHKRLEEIRSIGLDYLNNSLR